MRCIQLDTVDSTNAYARRLWAAGDITGPLYITAREQTAGRGNHGRNWLSPRDAGLYLTAVQPAVSGSLPSTTAYTLAAGVACAETLISHTGADIRLKPINDLYLAGGKLGGILVEAMIDHQQFRAVLTGVGINLTRAARPLPETMTRAISLDEVLPEADVQRLDRVALAQRLAEHIVRWNNRLTADGEGAVKAAWQQLAMP